MDRVLIIADNLADACPHSEAREVAASIRRSGGQARLVDLSRNPTTGDSEMSTTIPWPRRFCTATRARLKKLGRQFQPDQIQCWGLRAVSAGVVARAGQRANLVAVHDSTTMTVASHQNWKRRWELSQVDRHFVRSELAREVLERSCPRWNVSVLPWSRPAGPAEVSGVEVRRMLGIPPDAKLAGTVTPLFPGTRVKDFIWAADLMACIRDDVYWLVMGDGPHLWRLRRFARHLEAGDQLRFTGWHEQAASIIGALDVYVEPSTCFESSRGLVQALASGVPSVATTRPIHRQLVRHGHNGFVVERGARNEIARCVNRLVNQPAIAGEFSRNARHLADQALVDSRDLTATLLGSSVHSGHSRHLDHSGEVDPAVAVSA